MQKRKTAIGIVLVTMLLSAFLLIQPIAAEDLGYQNITAKQAHKMIKNHPEDVFILDVRNQSEYDLGHLYNAFLIPVYQLENVSASTLPQPPANDTFLWSMYEKTKSYQLKLHMNDTIIVYCAAGSRSAVACQILAENGFTKVYNMLGGITAWMHADYPIYTTYHHVTVDSVNHGKTIVDVEPWLLYQSSCTSCQNQSQPCPISSTLANTTETVIEENENHMVLLITSEINGTIREYTVDKTLVWQHNETSNDFNRTITFMSTIITAESNSTHLFGLYDNVQHEDYNITVGTVIYPLDLETYNRSITKIDYIPVGTKEITTVEQVDFNASVTLSQLYKSLGKAIDKLGKTYEKSEDPRLTVFAERYYAMANETQLLSRMVRTQIPEYNNNILNNIAVIQDGFWCDWCPVICPSAILIGCVIACYFSLGAGCSFCTSYVEYLSMGCEVACAVICGLEEEGPPQVSWASSIFYTGGSGSYTVGNPGGLIGPHSDNEFVHLHACNPGDCAQVFVELNEEATGYISIYGCSGVGYSSDMWVYVSPDSENWYFLDYQTITGTLPYSMYVGYVSSFPVKYIAINGFDAGNSVCLYLEAVSVFPG